MAPEEVNNLVECIRDGLIGNKTTATFEQPTVLPIDGFVNMNKTPYAWVRTFPTVYMPHYINHNGKMQWVILHDITGHEGPRQKTVSFNKWYEYQMWQSDGVPTAHSTFSLVLYNHKVKNSLQKQGQFVVNTSDMDPTIPVS